MTALRLGGPRAARRRTDRLRDGALVVESPRGLARESTFLVEALPKRDPGRSLFGMDSEAVGVLAARALWPEADVTWFHFDAYVAAKVTRVLQDNGLTDVEARVTPEVPEGPFDLIALPFPAASDHQLMWDLLEAAHDALRPGGRLIAATDGKPDAVRAAVKKVFRNVTPAGQGRRGGAAFYALRKREAAVLRSRAHRVRAVIRPQEDENETALDIETRPGTFAYRSFDAGTRALAEVWSPAGERSVLDLGAGCGGLGIYAALQLPDAHVTLVDSNARSIGCARRNADEAGVGERVETLLRADLEALPRPARGHDLVLANPPYFGDFRIARSFVTTAHDLLAAGGRALLVARVGGAGDGLAEIVREVFGDARVVEHAGYDVVTGVRK